jgi:DNA-binding response OmpR family regulator
MTTELIQVRPQVLLAGERPLFASELAAALAVYSADLAHCVVSAAVRTARGRTLHAIVLEVDDDTPVTIETIRTDDKIVPILVLGPGIGEAKVEALLGAGADGYVRNCGNAVELTARICALLRRTRTPCQV